MKSDETPKQQDVSTSLNHVPTKPDVAPTTDGPTKLDVVPKIDAPTKPEPPDVPAEGG